MSRDTRSEPTTRQWRRALLVLLATLVVAGTGNWLGLHLVSGRAAATSRDLDGITRVLAELKATTARQEFLGHALLSGRWADPHEHARLERVIGQGFDDLAARLEEPDQVARAERARREWRGIVTDLGLDASPPMRVPTPADEHGALAARMETVHRDLRDIGRGAEARLGAELDRMRRLQALLTAVVWAALGIALLALLLVGRRVAAATAAQNDELYRQARTDLLTGLTNRIGFQEHLAEVGTGRGAMCLLLADVDGLGAVNNTRGAPAGDALLEHVASGLREATRHLTGGEALLARIGGDEFAVVLHGPAALEGERIAQDILERSLRWPVFAGASAAGGLTIGLARRAGPGDGGNGADRAAPPGTPSFADRTGTDLVQSADLALQAGKTAGGGVLQVFDRAHHRGVLDRLELRAEISGAADRGEILVEYQPVVDLHDGSIVAVEALVRWEHPRHGRLGPNVFVPLAEETGAIRPVGAHVLAVATEQAAQWRRSPALPDDLVVNVNVSPRQLMAPTFVEDVRRALAGAALPPCALVLEVTESLLLEDERLAIEQLEALRRLGVRVALDDFGSGFSSLGYLGRLPIDALKIDRSLVSGATETGGYKAAVLEATVTLGHRLGLDVVVEGIETLEELEQVRGMGARRGQGYLFARPMSAAALAATCADRTAGTYWREWVEAVATR